MLTDSPTTSLIIVQCLPLVHTNTTHRHFPKSKARLLKLLDDTAPKGLLVLSGDVHFAEIAGRSVSTEDTRSARDGGASDTVGSGGNANNNAATSASKPTKQQRGFSGSSASQSDPSPIEVTSSGMTHSCSTPWFGAVCIPVLSTFSAHRWRQLQGYPHINWGALELDWEKKEMHVQVKDADGQTVLEAKKALGVAELLPLSSSSSSSSSSSKDGVAVDAIPSVYSNIIISVPSHLTSASSAVYATAFVGGVSATLLVQYLASK